MEWISVKDHLPEDDLPEDSKRCEIRVLACTAGRKASVKKVARTCYEWGPNTDVPVSKRHWRWSRDSGGITHWAYPPEVPPKEDA